MELVRNIKNKIKGDKKCGKCTPLEIIEVLLVHCNIVNNDY